MLLEYDIKSKIYDHEKSYLENVSEGPSFSDPLPKRSTLVNPPSRQIDFLGFRINSCLGVPAGPLLNAQWIALAARLGFDIPTYKTIRSAAHPGHPLPNILFVQRNSQNAQKINAPEHFEDLSITNSFGMPSRSAEFLMEDIEKANASLFPGQVMIVSIVGTPNQGISFLDDFVQTAGLAKAAGAKIIEANFSCPNVDKAEGSLYTSAETVFEFVKKIKTAIHPIPLIIKVGSFQSKEQMRAVFLAAERGGCSAICGLNSVSIEVVDHNNEPALGIARKTSGICGGAIRQEALQFMQDAAAIKQSEKLNLTLMGCGGLMTPEHLQWMLDAGAHVAMSATGMMWDPYLAVKFHQKVMHG
jgi:dihydroorotate dehydrogenase